MKVFRKILRLGARVLAILLVVAAGAVAALTLTEGGRTTLADLVSSAASGPDSGLRVSDIDNIWSGATTVGEIVLSDTDGPWLVIENATMDWSRGSILGSRFKAALVRAERIELVRLPQGPAGQDSGGQTELPIDIDVARFELPDIVLGDEIAGDIARLSAAGSALVEGSPLKLSGDLSVERTDGRPGSAKAQFAVIPEENRLDIAVDASEPQGGVIANLLDIEGAPPVSLSLSGKGPANDWAGEGTFSIDGEVVTRLSARHIADDNGSRVEGEANGNLQVLLPAGYRALAEGDTRIDFAGTVSEDGGIAVDTGRLRSDAVEVSLSGTYATDGATDLAFDLRTLDGPVALSVPAGEGTTIGLALASASGRAFGPGGSPMIDARIEAARIESAFGMVEGLDVSVHSDAFALAEMSGPVEMRASADAVGVVDETLARLLAGTVEAVIAVDLDPETITIRSADVSTGAATVSAEGELQRATGALSASLKADIASDVLPASARGALGERVAFSGTVGRSPEGAIEAEDIALQSGALSVAGSASLAESVIEASLEGTYADVARLSPQASGPVSFALSASGDIGAPQIDLTVASERLEAAGQTIESLELTATGIADMVQPSADVTLSGLVAGEELAGRATLRTQGSRREISELTVTLAENRIVGDLVLNEQFAPIGSIELTLPDLAPLGALALQDIQGEATGTARFVVEDGVPRATVEARIPEFARGEIDASGIRVQAELVDYLSMPGVSGTVIADRVRSGGTEIEAIKAELAREGEWTTFDVGLQANGIPANAAGRVRLAGAETTVELESASATVQELRASLARPGTIRIVDGQTRLEGLALSVGGGTVEVGGTIAETLDVEATIGALPISVVNQFAAGLDAQGIVSGTVKATGPPASPRVTYDIDWRDGSTAQTRDAGFGPMTVSSNGTFQDNRLRFTANLGDGSGLGLDGGGTVEIAGSRSLSMDFSGQVPFSFLAQRLAAQGLALEGNSTVNLSVRGTIGAPLVSGTITTAGTRFIAAQQGIAIDEISAEIGIGRESAVIRSLTGNLSTGGRISASGNIGIDASQGFPADLTATVSDGRYTDGRVVTANFGGNITIKGPLVQSPTLGGTINLDKTVITVPERLPGSISRLDVQHRNAPEAVRRQEEALRPAASESGGQSGLTLDLTVNAPRQIFVRGRGLDAELGGSLRMTGSIGAPQAVGRFDMRRGRLSILGRRLDFTSGTLGFSGSLVPYLNLEASSDTGEATVIVIVTGPATDPAFRFSSSPSLPEDEVLARLVFGRSFSELSPVQIAQLAAAAGQLAGVGGSTSLLDSIRDRTGVDDIDIKTNDEGEAAVSVGKYINDRTYVTIEKGSGSGSGKATIDLEIGRGLKLRGEARDDGEAKGGIFFEKDY